MPDQPVALEVGSIADTHAIAGAIADLARPGDVIVLAGEMGAGKTAFAQGFGRALGVTDTITSPTFTLVHSHPVAEGRRVGPVTLYHADLYRLDRRAEVEDLGLREMADDDGIVLVEWGDVVDVFGDHLTIRLEQAEIDPESDDDSDVLELDSGRRIEIDTVGHGWATRWAALVGAVEAYRC
jgi:tRNA threonylcarbamoyladenosine biosynthesis protein TsaE